MKLFITISVLLFANLALANNEELLGNWKMVEKKCIEKNKVVFAADSINEIVLELRKASFDLDSMRSSEILKVRYFQNKIESGLVTANRSLINSLSELKKCEDGTYKKCDEAELQRLKSDIETMNNSISVLKNLLKYEKPFSCQISSVTRYEVSGGFIKAIPIKSEVKCPGYPDYEQEFNANNQQFIERSFEFSFKVSGNRLVTIFDYAQFVEESKYAECLKEQTIFERVTK